MRLLVYSVLVSAVKQSHEPLQCHQQLAESLLSSVHTTKQWKLFVYFPFRSSIISAICVVCGDRCQVFNTPTTAQWNQLDHIWRKELETTTHACRSGQFRSSLAFCLANGGRLAVLCAVVMMAKEAWEIFLYCENCCTKTPVVIERSSN